MAEFQRRRFRHPDIGSRIARCWQIPDPSDILNKKEKLTDNEFALIKQHPVLGYDLLKELDLDYHVKQAALSHHERCDGSGIRLA